MESERALKARVAELAAPIGNLVELLKAGWTAALAEVGAGCNWRGAANRRPARAMS